MNFIPFYLAVSLNTGSFYANQLQFFKISQIRFDALFQHFVGAGRGNCSAGDPVYAVLVAETGFGARLDDVDGDESVVGGHDFFALELLLKRDIGNLRAQAWRF